MLAFRESFPGRASGTLAGSSLGRIALALLLATGMASADPAHAAQVQELEPDSTARGNAEPAKTESDGAYVSHVLGTPVKGAIETAPLVIEPPSERPRAAAYARKYGISEDLALVIVRQALAEGIDPELGFRLIRVESVFKPTARGPQGALGLMQLMPGTARSLDRTLDTPAELFDPDRNLRVGFRYLRQLIERYEDVRLGLLAYNRGETAVDRALRRGADPENGYSRKVLGTREGNRYTGTGLVPPRPRISASEAG
jgi:soluble lytic murein transglycosylase-like protein